MIMGKRIKKNDLEKFVNAAYNNAKYTASETKSNRQVAEFLRIPMSAIKASRGFGSALADLAGTTSTAGKGSPCHEVLTEWFGEYLF